MKLRIRGNTVRLRLNRGEVDQIAAGTSVVEQTHFPNCVLTYQLDVTDGNEISANFYQHRLIIDVPREMALDWANPDNVSLQAEQKVDGTGPLSLLIEKDFTCLAPGHSRDSEDDKDTFPHPNAGIGTC